MFVCVVGFMGVPLTDALRKAVAAKENTATAMMIPRPPSGSGVAGNGFNLQIAMRLEDDTSLYAALRVS